MKKDDISRLLQHYLSRSLISTLIKSMKCWTALKIRTIILTLMKS